MAILCMTQFEQANHVLQPPNSLSPHLGQSRAKVGVEDLHVK